MRKRFEGLYGLVRDRLSCEPLSGHLFLFCNGQRNRLRVLVRQRVSGQSGCLPFIVRYGRPAVKAAKIQKRVGFHTFRHTYTTLLTQNNEEVKVVRKAPTSCEQSHYAGSLRSGGYAEQAAGAKQTGSDGAQ